MRLWTVYELATFCRAHRDVLRSKLVMISVEWPSSLSPLKRPSSLSPLKRAGLSAREEGWLAGFSCVNARCYKPSDGARLLGNIRAQWGSEGAFDTFVRTELLEVMRESKAVYEQQLWNLAAQSFELVFGE